jgi:peroxiredoxin
MLRDWKASKMKLWIETQLTRIAEGHAGRSPSNAFGVAPLRFAPSGDCARPARPIVYQDVLLVEPSNGRFRQQNILVAKTPSTRAGVNPREATGEAGLGLTPSTATACRTRRSKLSMPSAAITGVLPNTTLPAQTRRRQATAADSVESDSNKTSFAVFPAGYSGWSLLGSSSVLGRTSQGVGEMSQDTAHARSATPLAVSLSEFTEKLIARRGVEQSSILFEGQIGPAAKALSARTNAIGIGDKAPHFSLPTADGGMWSLEESLDNGEYDSLVVVFYRGTWCGYCNLYLRGLLEVRPQLSDANAALIAVSPEAAPASAEEASTEGARFPVLVDHGGKAAEQFGLAFEMNDGAKTVLKTNGFDLERRNADGRWILPVPGTFVIDRSGNVAYAHVDADYRNRPEPQDIVVTCRSLRI